MNRACRSGLAILALAGVCSASASAGWGPAATAAPYPYRPIGPVYDGANIIPETAERQIVARLRNHNAQAGHALVVATVPSLGGEAIGAYAATVLLSEWTIGGVELEPDVLVLLAPNEREMRIEVGREARRQVTDDLVDRVIRDEFMPRFKEGDVAGAIDAGVAALIAELDRLPAEDAAVAEATAAAEDDEPGPWSWRPRSWGHWANIIAWFVWWGVIGWLWFKLRRHLFETK